MATLVVGEYVGVFVATVEVLMPKLEVTVEAIISG